MPTPNPPRRSLFAVWRWPWWVWAIAVVFLMLVAYPLSYAPCERLRKELFKRSGLDLSPSDFAIYRPVDWLYDNTQLQYPLRRWARWWGMDFQFDLDSAIRTGEFWTTKDGQILPPSPISATDPPK